MSFKQEDYDQKVGWFCGLFVASGSFYIGTNRHGTSAGRLRYTLGAHISVPINRQEVLKDIIDVFGVGHIQKKSTPYFNRAYWEVQTNKGVDTVVELLEQLEWPLPLSVALQLDIAKKFIDLRVERGSNLDKSIMDGIYLERDKLCTKMKMLNNWKKNQKEPKKVNKEDESEKGRGDNTRHEGNVGKIIRREKRP